MNVDFFQSHDQYFIVIIGLVVLYFLLWSRFFYYKKHAQNLLFHAKQETHYIAQLPLNNPHPQIQISQSGEIIFANTSALKLFPSIQKEKFNHAILSDVENNDHREILFEGKIYSQTITSAIVNEEKTYIVYCFDITDRKNHERDIKLAHKHSEKMRLEAEKAKEARGEFLANMSHELRTPMNGIIGLSDILVDMKFDDERQKLIKAVNSSARNLLILLNDILDFSKIEAGELMIEKIIFDLRKNIEQTISLQIPMAEKKGLELQVNIEKNIPNYFIGDPSRLQQILNNLISNAIKFTDFGTVKLSISGGQDAQNDNNNFMMSISVADTGIGIPLDKQSKIFEKFQQADTSTARKYGGTGLGLSITRHLVSLLGGEISVQSEEGKGTIFTINIAMPVAECGESNSVSDNYERQLSLNLNTAILVADDHPVNLLFIRHVLTDLGFNNIDEATTGAQALQLYQEGSHGLIVMDCQMPDMDGYEATQQIRLFEQVNDLTPAVIIAATADAMKGVKDKCESVGMNDLIVKPIERSDLYSKLQKWIPCSTGKMFDAHHLKDFTNGDKDFEKEILDVFIKNLSVDIHELQNHFDTKNYNQWNECVHKIYGASAHVGAISLSDICNEGQNLKSDQGEKINGIHRMIINEYHRISENRR